MRLTHQVPDISTLHSPIANLEHPFALSVIDGTALEALVVVSAECKRMFQIGDRRMQSADFRTVA